MKPLTVDPGRVVLFREHNKSNDKAPDLRGACNINGIQYELALWQRESKIGVKYLSGEIKPSRAQAPATERPPQDDDLDTAMAPVDDAALRRQANQSFTDASKKRWG